MALNIRELSRICEFSLELKLLGAVRCLSLNANHISQANKKLASTCVQHLDFARWLFGEMVRRPTEECSDEVDPIEGISLTTEELNSITNEELEEFAEKLIHKNNYLLKTHKGRDLEMSADESACDFLVRAFRHHAAEQDAQSQAISNSLAVSKVLESTQRNLGLLGQYQAAADMYASQSVVERMMLEERDKWLSMNRLADQTSAAAEAIKQLNYGTVADANGYLSKEANAAAEAIRQLSYGTVSDANRYLSNCRLDESLAGMSSSMLAKAVYHQEDMLREAFLGVAQVTTMPITLAATMEKQQQEARELLKCHEAMFRLPQASEMSGLLAAYQVGGVAEYTQQLTMGTLDRQYFLESISTPWLNNVETARSVNALIELQCIGNALKTTKGFDPELTKALRLDFGDWRDKITFTESVIVEPVARTDFYVARGFNIALTDFPETAFHQSLYIAGIDGEELDIKPYGSVVQPSVDSEEEAGMHRTNECHDLLQRFERRMRQFINDVMTAQYGHSWPKKQLPPELYGKWEEKKQKAEKNGEILALIEVADFTDYETIICKKDHWREIFENRFKRKESVRESFQRLYPIRITTMHSRIVTKEDELYLKAEIVRLFSAVK